VNRKKRSGGAPLLINLVRASAKQSTVRLKPGILGGSMREFWNRTASILWSKEYKEKRTSVISLVPAIGGGNQCPFPFAGIERKGFNCEAKEKPSKGPKKGEWAQTPSLRKSHKKRETANLLWSAREVGGMKK